MDTDDSQTIRTFSPAEVARFRQAFVVMIRTFDKGKELGQVDNRDHVRIIGKLKDLAKDWAVLIPDQEWLSCNASANRMTLLTISADTFVR